MIDIGALYKICNLRRGVKSIEEALNTSVSLVSIITGLFKSRNTYKSSPFVALAPRFPSDILPFSIAILLRPHILTNKTQDQFAHSFTVWGVMLSKRTCSANKKKFKFQYWPEIAYFRIKANNALKPPYATTSIHFPDSPPFLLAGKYRSFSFPLPFE